jgi:hypothetical protein
VTQIRAGKGRLGDFRHPIEPWAISARCPAQESRVPADTLDVVSGLSELGQFGVDRAEPGFGPVVFSVPPQALVDLGTELLDTVFA